MSSGQLLIPIEYLEVPLPAACFLVRPPFWNKSAPFYYNEIVFFIHFHPLFGHFCVWYEGLNASGGLRPSVYTIHTKMLKTIRGHLCRSIFVNMIYCVRYLDVEMEIYIQFLKTTLWNLNNAYNPEAFVSSYQFSERKFIQLVWSKKKHPIGDVPAGPKAR